MKSLYHFILGFFLSLVFYLFGLELEYSLLFFLSSFLFIDLDHIFLFVLEKKSINPFSCLNYFDDQRNKLYSISKKEKEQYKKSIFFFHSIEFLLILTLFSFFSLIFFWILMGWIFHLFTDHIDLVLRREPFYSKASLLLTLKRNKNKKKLVF